VAFGRAAAALGLAAALVIGVPLLLITVVGNPLPSELPSLNEIRILLTQNGQGFTHFLISTLSMLIWVIWAQLIVALVAEVIATARHIETRRLRIVPGMQGVAARLITSITLATVLAAGPLVAPALGALSFDDVASAAVPSELVVDVRATPLSITGAPIVTAQGGNAAISSRAAMPSRTGLSADEATYMVVADHTELWDLAETAYGDGVAWKRIAQANAGSTDANGVAITAETEVVAPGTELVLPGVINGAQVGGFGSLIARQGPEAHPQAALAGNDLQRVDSGDSMWTMAENRVADQLGRPGTEAEVASYWVDVVASNRDVLSGDVDMIYPGEMLDMSGRPSGDKQRLSGAVLDPAHETSSAPNGPEYIVADGPIGPRSSSPTRDGDPLNRPILQPVEESVSPSATHGSEPTPVAVAVAADTSVSNTAPAHAAGLVALGTAMLSAGVVSAIRRRRDAQRRTRPAGTMAPAPSSEAAAFEAAILHSSHELKESTQGLGWRAMPASTVQALRTAGTVEVHAAASGQLVAVAVSSIGDDTLLERLHLGPESSGQSASPVAAEAAGSTTDGLPANGAPAMAASVIIGTETITGEAVLLDLIASTPIGLSGSIEHVRRFVRSAVLDLAVSERAGDICVIAIGVGNELADLERVHVVSSYSEALSHIVRTGHGGGDGTTPVVALSASAPPSGDRSVQSMLDIGATVMAPGIDAASTVSIESDRVVIGPSGTIAVPAALDDDDYRAVSELVETTSPTAIELVDPSMRVEDVLDVAAVADCPVDPGLIEVKILGPVLVSGAAPFSSLKAVDVITYLAFHRHGVDADQIKSWVWPPFDPPTDKAFANVMSRARTGLGADVDGGPYLSRAGADKTYRLDSAVTTDFDRVRALGELADRSHDSSATLVLLRQALELIRGVPFTGGAASSFAWADNHVRAQVEYTIDEMVHRCADLALKLGDLGTARWAALKGLELVPGCEQCFRRRFLIARAGNNRSELRRAMVDLEAAAMVDLGEPEAVDNISGDLLDLYHELDRALVAGTS
jgi:hypothetical protein